MAVQHYQLKVAHIIRETNDAVSLVFEQPPATFAYKPGQYLTFLLNIGGESIRRAYSLCTSPLLGELPAVTVKRVENGVVSNYLNEQVQVGDTLEVLEPMGHFTLEVNEKKKRHVILFGGGSGITPLMSLAKSVLYKEPKSTVSLIYANRSLESAIFKKTLDELQQQFPKTLNVIHILEQAPDAQWQESTGLLDTALIKNLLKRLPNFIFNPTEYYMCGPRPMMDVVEKAFAELKLSKNNLRKEIFTSNLEEKTNATTVSSAEDAANLPTTTVTILYDGETHQVAVRADQTILEAALALNIDLPYSCQSGMCTACMGKCTSGKVKLDEEDALTPKELDEGYVLTCVGHPLTEDVVIQID
ncbi:MAG TPA: oxidoreductase [Microscillaceae bacterium]|jgi:ring-1,2-phenylacetyl-CoA epoxidase subunit PaaE|nr:oxidoreductase [Microscillaceae bacterium]